MHLACPTDAAAPVAQVGCARGCEFRVAAALTACCGGSYLSAQHYASVRPADAPLYGVPAVLSALPVFTVRTPPPQL
jgi:hypothetical protein